MREDIQKKIIEFRDNRDWKQFHNPRSLAISISIEAAELLELFQWAKDEELIEVAMKKLTSVKEELADILIYLILLSVELDIDLWEAIEEKLDKNESKYPIEKSKGLSNKYTEI